MTVICMINLGWWWWWWWYHAYMHACIMIMMIHAYMHDDDDDPCMHACMIAWWWWWYHAYMHANGSIALITFTTTYALFLSITLELIAQCEHLISYNIETQAHARTCPHSVLTLSAHTKSHLKWPPRPSGPWANAPYYILYYVSIRLLNYTIIRSALFHHDITRFL